MRKNWLILSLKLNGKNRTGAAQAHRVYAAARTYIRRAQAAIKTGVETDAQAEVKNAIKALDKAVSMGVIHKNNAARRKSRLVKKLNSLQ